MPVDGQTLAGVVRVLAKRSPLDDLDREAFLALPHRRQDVEPGAYLVREGDRPEHCVAVLSGYVYRHKITGNGGRQIVSLHIPGDMVDLHNALLPQADHNVQALTRGQIAIISRKAIESLAFQRTAVGRALWLSTLVDGSIFREWIANVGRRDARTRIAHLLCEFATRMEVAELSGVFELPMTQEQLADATGLTSVHVNRMLRSLRTDGLISSSQRSVTIEDWRGLREAGDFASDYLHLDIPLERRVA